MKDSSRRRARGALRGGGARQNSHRRQLRPIGQSDDLAGTDGGCPQVHREVEALLQQLQDEVVSRSLRKQLT